MNMMEATGRWTIWTLPGWELDGYGWRDCRAILAHAMFMALPC